MAEKKAVGHAYNIDFLNVVFAVSSLFLFLSVIWMVWDDYDREWKKTQRNFNSLEIEVTRATLDQAGRRVDRNRLKTLEAERAEGDKKAKTNQQKVDELQSQLKQIDARLYRANQEAQFTKATYDVDRYDYEVSRDKGEASADRKRQHVEELERRLNDLNLDVERITAERAKVQQELSKFTGELIDATKKIEELTAEQTRLRKRLATINPSLVKDYFRDAPLLDFMAPTIKVQQIITPNVVDDVNFTVVPKMDRCTTCHLAIDKKGYEKYPQPYTTHPNLSVFLGGDSAHPLDRVGCTVCHGGMGQSISFRDSAHTPADPKQQHEWEEKFGWVEPHLWDYPMLPRSMTEAACVSCHRGEVYIPSAPRLSLAYATYERAGCYACHKTRGFENLRKPGPILTKVASKLNPEWVKTWIRNPRAVKPSTWMPKPWYNSNSNSSEDAVRNEIEINATVAYLFAKSETYQVAVTNPPRGDAQRGEAVVKSIGCLGCHVTDNMPRPEAGPRRTFGQPLENIGNKTTYEWLFDWVRDPKHYNPETFMPDLRLTDQEVADVATYLMTLKGAAGESAKATPDAKALDAVLLDYLMATLPSEEAKATLAKMDESTRQIELGQRVIARYGCFSCHEIKGFEKQQPIGIELSEEGSKLLARLDFGFVDIEHSKIGWFHQKVKDPRIFDKGRVLRQTDKLRMPDYGVSDVEAERLVTAIMSLQRDLQPQAAMPPRSAHRDAVVAGRQFTRRRNCVTCHTIEGEGGEEYRSLVSDPSLAPPLLTPEGAKVQPDWLYAFLRGPITIRPWLDVRMPTFGLADPNLNDVIRYFGAVSNSMGPFQSHDAVRASNLAGPGKGMFELLKCQQCHVLGAIPKDQPTSNLAPDLRMASARLQPEWILEWLKNPARIQPGTRMPSFWPDYPKSFYPQLSGDADAQIRSIRDHLLTLRGGPNPKQTVPSDPQIASP